MVRVGCVVFSLTPWAPREARPRPPACSRHLHCEKEPGLGVLPPCPLPPTGPGAHAGAWHRATATGPGIAPFSMEPGQKAACAHLVLPITVITAAAGPFQAGIKMPLKRSNGWGYLYFWFSVAPLLNLHPTKGREHPPHLGSVRNHTQKSRGRQQHQGHTATVLLPHGAIWLAKRKMLSVYEAKAQTDPLLAQLPQPKAAGMPSVPV